MCLFSPSCAFLTSLAVGRLFPQLSLSLTPSLSISSYILLNREPEPTSDGLHPSSDGLQPNSNGLQPNSDGLQPNERSYSSVLKLEEDCLGPASLGTT